MNTKSRTRSLIAWACLMSAGMNHGAVAQEWPAKPIRIIEPYQAGFARDPRTRYLSEKLSVLLDQQVYVENRPGAGGRIAAQVAVAAAPDGYTFNMMGTADILAKHLYSLPYDIERDLVPVTMIVTAPSGLLVRSSMTVKNLSEFIRHAKAHPGALTYGSTGVGSFAHVNALRFSGITHTNFVHVPYGQGNPLTDLLGGHIDMLFDGVGTVYLENIKAGKLHAIALTGETRTGALPDVPTFAEGGVPAYDSQILFGLFAPKKTPDSIILKMQTVIAKALQEPSLRQQWTNEGAIPVGSTSAEFAARLHSESERWGKVIRDNHIKVE
jgi:tripartite-type tricarboxylate transporter receptor subunit TctC